MGKSSAVLHLHDAHAVHVEFSDQEAREKLAANSIYVDLISPKDAVAYGKEIDFFQTIGELENAQKLRVRTWVSGLNAMVPL